MQKTGQHKKILFIITQGCWGGAQIYVLDLAKNFSGQYETLIASGTEDAILAEKAGRAGVRYAGLKHLRREIHPFHELAAIWEIRRLIKKERPGIVHLNSSKAGVLGSLAAAFLPVKVVYTMHGLVLTEPLPFWKKAVYFLAEKTASFFRHRLIAVSEADRKAALRYGLKKSEDIAVVPNGLDFQGLNFLPKLEARDKLSALANTDLTSCPLVGTIADFYPTKGLKYLTAAAESVLKQQPATRFLIIGRAGPDLPEIRQILEARQLTEKILIVSGLSNAQSCLKAFDAFVLPSVKEGFPYTLLEAAAAELPIVATVVGGNPEIVPAGCSLLVPPADPKALADAILKILRDPEFAARLAKNASSHARVFTLQATLQKTKRVYET